MQIPGVKWFALAALVCGALAGGLAEVFPSDGTLVGVIAAAVATGLAGLAKWLQDAAQKPPAMPPGAAGSVHYVPARSRLDTWWNG